MPVFRNNAQAILTPEDVGTLLIEPLIAQSIAAQAATVVTTDAASFRIPKLVNDGGASWVAEGQPIPLSAPTFAETVVVPTKVAKLVPVSSEAAADTTPAAAQVVGDAVSRALADAVDEAFVGPPSANPNAPGGLGSLGGSAATLYAGAEFGNLDVFAEAAAAVEQTGTEVTAWIASPADALALAKLKSATGSAVPLLAPTPGQASRRTVEGVPILVSRFVPSGVIYGVPSSRVFVVIRQDAEIVTDSSYYFDSDQLAVRGTLRVGFGLPQPGAVVRILRTDEP